MLLDVDGRQDVLGDHALGQDDGVLVVEAFPGHVRDQQVLAQCEFTVVGGGPVRDHGAGLHAVALGDDHALVVRVARVRAHELVDRVELGGAVVVQDGHEVRGDFLDHAGLGGQHRVAGVQGRVALHTGAHEWRLGREQRHGLTLHVGAHERAVGVVVLEVRDQGGGHRHHLARGHVHELDVRGGHEHRFTRAVGGTREDGVLGEATVVGQRSVGLRNGEPSLVVRGEVDDVVGYGAVHDAAVGRLDETERVDPRVGRERTDQTDVRAFRRLDRAHAAVMRGVHVTDLHARAIAGEATGTQRG